MDGQKTVNSKFETTTEEFLADICQELIGVSDVKPTDDFFEIGGTSLVAVMFLHRIEARYGEDALDPETLYENAQLRSLASVIDSRTANKKGERLQSIAES